MCRRGTTSLLDMFLTKRLHRTEDSSTWFWPFMLSCLTRSISPDTKLQRETWARYTFMTGVSCSSELCGRMALLFECSFSRFCKKPLLLRPSIMTVLLEARLTRVLLGGKKRGAMRLISIYKYAIWARWRVHAFHLSTQGCTASSMPKKKSFLPFWL